MHNCLDIAISNDIDKCELVILLEIFVTFVLVYKLVMLRFFNSN